MLAGVALVSLGAWPAVLLWGGELHTWLLAALVAAATTAVSGWVGLLLTKAQEMVQDAAGRQPFTVTVERRSSGYDGYTWLVPLSAAELPQATEVIREARDATLREASIYRNETQAMVDRFGPWAMERGGIAASYYDLTILVEGRSAQAVVLRGIRVTVLSRAPFTDGIVIRLTSHRVGGVIEPRGFRLDLDDPVPNLRPTSYRGTPTVPFPYSVSQGDPEIFYIEVSSHRTDCAFQLEIDWTADGTNGTCVVNDDSEPFRIAGRADRAEYQLDLSVSSTEFVWTECDRT